VLSDSDIAEITRKYRCALASLRSVDDGVGRILDTLRNQGQLGSTYILYTSDNGFLNGEHRLAEGKLKPYEESLRVPLVMRGPGLPHGKTVRDLTINADLAPTIVALSGARPGLKMDGRSLLPAAERPWVERGRELELDATGFSGVRTQRYLYVSYLTQEHELYDLKRDPYELQNVADDPAYAAVRARLDLRLERLRDCAGSTCRLRPRIRLAVSTAEERKRCARPPLQVKVGGVQRGDVVEARFYLGGRPIGDDSTAPFGARVHTDPGTNRVAARVSMLDGRRMTVERRVVTCG
jgi:arylsulfatase A-like enzyme